MTYTDEQIAQMTLVAAMNEVENAVYEATALIERLERAGKIHGNGHHVRQRIAEFAMDAVLSRWVE